ncbi:GTP 3',8-cyclase MoaA [Haloferax mediterranei ATCC 33500]|uniref:Probable GTP 3',8-cyclase n=1 Tax=Haloferax mediterranei (strain ATCC 33500 / DSM 1411 / JCM 8866 / NBRC 14739 / NCIMB 2177 / R-4) TaxID=523841 RepID=I3R8B5_HALMT|nr:GTP 3',8-cyclase MoaA [Haloferax mediterranei]AFK20475.1 molybdenum cofactor biosynthesis protein A [Haloferax mediterranei ATCC 33500]AHZ23836.1 radical SAM protein [Haloferax mediterranei ATCC 33500]ELZ98260.1 molybdenum cofactor biosynthesis protein A [Haloferax mediterranei ATCC 33500]MDX5986768.1 GTP 3',8-cyclase MoaA [Haloferax mediterranei ATCC 33500]QCQ76093.1 GTP 3',8-cyclase MoaA [Haloferax mediterranei ATCC 33500]
MVLVDDFGREVTGVRISLTDRCNFDCVYCHNEGLGDTRGPMDASDDEMSADDVVRFLDVVEEYGVKKVKFTGGEPMLRADLEEIIRRTPESMETSLTTNGTFLPDRADDLVEVGLDRVNVSQDALDPEAFAEITKSGAYDKVMEGVKAAVDAGLTPVKLNMVVFTKTAGYVEDMVEYVAENEGLQLQLIQYMPELTGRPEWNIDIERVHKWLTDLADEVEVRDMHNRRRYYVGNGSASDASGAPSDASGGGMVEIVDPVENAEFCANCHRVRVTHQGYLKGCLNRNDDLRPMGEMTRTDIQHAFEEVVANRVPYYGEYLVRDGDGGWTLNEEYIGV